MRALFIAGSHTDVGKTYVACALLRAAPRIQSDGQNGYRLSPYAADVRPPPDGRDYLPWGGSGGVDAETELVPVTGSHRVACLSQAKVQS